MQKSNVQSYVKAVFEPGTDQSAEEPLASLAGATMRLDRRTAMAEVLYKDQAISFGGIPAIMEWVEENGVSRTDAQRLLELDAQGSGHEQLSREAIESLRAQDPEVQRRKNFFSRLASAGVREEDISAVAQQLQEFAAQHMKMHMIFDGYQGARVVARAPDLDESAAEQAKEVRKELEGRICALVSAIPGAQGVQFKNGSGLTSVFLSLPSGPCPVPVDFYQVQEMKPLFWEEFLVEKKLYFVKCEQENLNLLTSFEVQQIGAYDSEKHGVMALFDKVTAAKVALFSADFRAEEFLSSPEADVSVKKEPRPELFGYYINLNERGEFYADVRNRNEDTIFEVHSNEEGAVELIEDGFMSDVSDVSGLAEHLSSLGFIPEGACIYPEREFEEKLAHENENENENEEDADASPSM